VKERLNINLFYEASAIKGRIDDYDAATKNTLLIEQGNRHRAASRAQF
jgi:hypothetical protein